MHITINDIYTTFTKKHDGCMHIKILLKWDIVHAFFGGNSPLFCANRNKCGLLGLVASLIITSSRGFFLYNLFIIVYSGVSANADPHTNKLRTRVTHIWGYRRRQLSQSAMEEPLPGGTALLITVSPVPGKYAVLSSVDILSSCVKTIMWCGKGRCRENR